MPPNGNVCLRCGATVISAVPAAASNSTTVIDRICRIVLCGVLPVVGLVIMAFAATDESAKNFGKAGLILCAALVVIIIILAYLEYIPEQSEACKVL